MTSAHFVLKRVGYGYTDIYEAIKNGEKTSEWRDASEYWASRLLTKEGREMHDYLEEHQNRPRSYTFTKRSRAFNKAETKHTKAVFVVGYTKFPRLEADIVRVKWHEDGDQFEVQINNVKEVDLVD